MGILVYIEASEGKPAGAGLELLTAAKAVGTAADAVLVGKDLDDAAAVVAASGAATVSVVEADDPTEDYLTAVLSTLGADEDLVLVAASATGKAIAPRIAARLDAGIVTDATSITAVDGGYEFTRPAFGGTVIEKLKSNGKTVVVVRGGSYERAAADQAAVPVEKKTVDVPDADLKAKKVDFIAEEGEQVNLEEADVIVSGGRGMGSKEDFQLIWDLAKEVNGVVGASRPAVENDWVPRQHQVGQSGKIVSPSLYIAAGISGATQHLSGMSSSKYVIAINKDEEAPIFEIADVGIVGDAKKAIPLMIDAIKAHKA